MGLKSFSLIGLGIFEIGHTLLQPSSYPGKIYLSVDEFII